MPKKFADDWWVRERDAHARRHDARQRPDPRRCPGSHHWAPINVPYVNQGDWEPAPISAEDQARVPTDLGAPYPGEVLVTAPAGAAIICNSSMWHSGTVKKDDPPTGACCT